MERYTNTASNGGGGVMVQTDRIGYVQQCTFIANSVATFGGGFQVLDFVCYFTPCTFNANIASYGGGISAFEQYAAHGFVLCSACTFDRNLGRSAAGAIEISKNLVVTLTACTSPYGNVIMFHFKCSYLNEIRVFLHRNWFQFHLVRSGNP